jgi:heme-degrading monooxygenase HmoA
VIRRALNTRLAPAGPAAAPENPPQPCVDPGEAVVVQKARALEVSVRRVANLETLSAIPLEEDMILRTWRGMTRIEDKDRYLAYLRATGVKEYKATPGNEGVFVVWRERDGKAEFFLLTLWESMEAVQSFAGPRLEAAVFYPEDEQFLVDKDNHVDHYEVLEGPAVV